MSGVSMESFISSEVIIIILVIVNLGVNLWYTRTTLRMKKEENEGIENRHRKDKIAVEKRYKEELKATNLRHKEMLDEQRRQFSEQLNQMKEHQAKELEVKVIVESQKERIDDIRELVNEFISETASLKGNVNKIMQKRYREKAFFNENFEKINASYYEAVESLQDKKTSLEFRLSELENTSSLLNLTKKLYLKTIRTPTHIKDLETYTYIEQYNDEHNEMKTEFINEASKFLKNEWKDLYNKIDKLSDF